MKKKIFNFLALLLVACTVFSMTSCKKDQIYCEIGMSLPKDFKEMKDEDAFDKAYSNGEIVVGITRMSFDACLTAQIPTTLSPLKFAEFYKEKTEKDGISTKTEEYGDAVYYTYTQKVDGKEYFYMPTFYRTPYAYFVIMFVCPSALSELLKPEMLDYTKTIYLID